MKESYQYHGRKDLSPTVKDVIDFIFTRYLDGDIIVIESGNVFIVRSSINDLRGRMYPRITYRCLRIFLNKIKEKGANNIINFLFVSSNHVYLREYGRTDKRLVEHITHQSFIVVDNIVLSCNIASSHWVLLVGNLKKRR